MTRRQEKLVDNLLTALTNKYGAVGIDVAFYLLCPESLDKYRQISTHDLNCTHRSKIDLSL